MSEQHEHGSAVRAGVAELEALVDQRKVWKQVSAWRACEGRPVRVGARAQVQALDRAPVGLHRAYRLAARALHARHADTARGDVKALHGAGPHAAGEQLVEHREALLEL